MDIYTKYSSHEYKVTNIKTGSVSIDEKLPRLLKQLREETGFAFKIPHGNKVRTLILEEGACYITNDNGEILYAITIIRWF